MAATLSNKAQALVERPVIANVATVDSDGRPQLTPVWIDLDRGDLVFNTAKGRAKTVNLERNPHVAVSIVAPTMRTTWWSSAERWRGPKREPMHTSTRWPRST